MTVALPPHYPVELSPMFVASAVVPFIEATRLAVVRLSMKSEGASIRQGEVVYEGVQVPPLSPHIRARGREELTNVRNDIVLPRLTTAIRLWVIPIVTTDHWPPATLIL